MNTEHTHSLQMPSSMDTPLDMILPTMLRMSAPPSEVAEVKSFLTHQREKPSLFGCSCSITSSTYSGTHNILCTLVK